jgi:predicted TIM-barrel enzyme
MTEREGMQEQINALHERMNASRTDTDQNRADIDQLQKMESADRTDIERLQVGAEVDRQLIAELQAEGLLRADYSAQLEDALRSARTIGAALGIVMSSTGCGQAEACAMLVKVSQSTGRKLREVAKDVVLTGALP